MAAPKPTAQTPQASRLLPAKRAAREYGIAYGSLRDLVHRGELAVVRVGRAWYFERCDIDSWIASRKEIIAA